MLHTRLIEPGTPDLHEYAHPDNGSNLRRAIALLVRMPGCSTCGELPTLVAGPGSEWVIDHVHQFACAEAKEPEAYAVNVIDGYDAGAHQTVEAIWDRSNPEEQR